MTDPAKLAGAFAELTKSDWRELAETGLKGADFERSLVSRTLDDIRVEPVYERAKSAILKSTRAGRPWTIAQRMDHPSCETANKQALIDLENGATGLALVFSGAPTSRGYGLQVANVADIETALAGIQADHIHLRLEGGASGIAVAGLLTALAEKRSYDFSELDWSLGQDPVGTVLGAGFAGNGFAPALTDLGDLTHDLLRRGFSGRICLADGRPWHEAGASEAQELAAILAAALLYLRTLEKAGIDLATAWQTLEIAIAIDPDQFLGLAKLRALNMLLGNIARACGLENSTPVPIHGESDWRSQTRHDPHVNMLRATMATFVAGIGGATSFAILPFTSAAGLADEFSRRVARNTQLVLMEESNLARVTDPLAGSGYGEALSSELAAKAWELFQKIETGGGIIEVLDDGWLQDQVLETAETRASKMAHGKAVLTGTSSFPNLAGTPPVVLDVSPSDKCFSENDIDLPLGGEGERFSALVKALGDGESLTPKIPEFAGSPFTPLPSLRLAEPFEALRQRADSIAEKNQRPLVFLAGLGPVAGFVARANWTENTFATAGIATHLEAGLEDGPNAAAAFRKSSARIACICGPDALYRAQAGDMAAALLDAGATRIFMAGRPGDLTDALEGAGISVFLYGGCDIIAALENVLIDYENA